jgi:Flp pilus assembly protein TadD
MEGKCMSAKSWLFGVAVAVMVAGPATRDARAGDLKIRIPRRGILTPVQRLNRDGVEALKKHNISKAEELFYKAYLYDPQDSFTLNNLGYISEIQGQLDRAEKFYALAASQPSDATVDIASAKRVQGRPMSEAVLAATGPLEVNHANVEAVRLLAQGRAAEADLLLQEALKSDPNNVFTLNNLGAAKEMEGEAEDALRYFDEAAQSGSAATAVVTADRQWRGHPISRMAQENAKDLRNHLAHRNDLAEQVAELNLRGVSAVNRNDLRAAEQDFRKAYALDPSNAFSLNNIGYVAEMEGDEETAQFFYDRAREAVGASLTVGVASRSTAQGRKLFAVSEDSDSRVEAKVTQERDAMRRQNEPVVLRRRDNSIVDDSSPSGPPSDHSITPR